jgi:hypothetical protein
VIPSAITTESGDNQWSRRGTPLPDPLQVRVRFDDGTAAAGYRVLFATGGVGGELSATVAETNRFGIASTRLTLGDQTGVASVRATLDVDPEAFVDFSATSSEFYCPEEDPTFEKKFSSGGPVFNDLFLFTRRSSLFDGAGIIRVTPGAGVFEARTVREFDREQEATKIVRDVSFSASGDLFLAWLFYSEETVKISPDDFSFTRFSTLESSLAGSEITMTPAGVLVGCDEFGPFAVGCRDTLARFDEATFEGVDANDFASADAAAADPATGDIYYIDVTGLMLMRLPMDGLTASGPPEAVTDLTADEAGGASGMVVDDRDGSVYMLVDTEDTRAIVRVTSALDKDAAVDFFTARGAGDAAGRQNDLAIDRDLHFLYTVDRLNDELILWDIVQEQLSVLVPDQDTDPGALSTQGVSTERIGLVVVPNSGL